MTALDDILHNNASYQVARDRPVTKFPDKKLAVFTCMDTRLVENLEPAMGVKRGDAVVIKNAGATIVDADGAEVRSLVVAIYALGCEEICVIGHQDCGMSQVDPAQLRQRMQERGIPDSALESDPVLAEWVGGFQNVHNNVRAVTETIRRHPLIPNDLPVHGLVCDPATGRLELVVNGYPADHS